ncbi:hypothetical protein [Devosia sp.]|uniref:hypothetical protein n=1 Tax=Devosia sp. TaxID=1871048 RepID=UPI003A9161AF
MSDDQQSFKFNDDARTIADRTVVKNSYELALNSLSRLSSYGSAGESVDAHGEVATRQTQLATEDVLHLAISLRRLISANQIHNRAKNISVPSISFRSADRYGVNSFIDGEYTLWSALNKLIHSTELRLLNFSFEALLESRMLTASDIYHLTLNRHQYRFPPVCILKTENGQQAKFHVSALCDAAGDALEAAEEKAGEINIFLGSLYTD